MGINSDILKREQGVLDHYDLKYSDLVWGELGCQAIRKGKRGRVSAKDFYEDRGAEHVSIDINGLLGSVPLDLNEPLPLQYVNRFDVVTNYGTIEHVNNQYQVFKNMHDMCKVGGIMIHTFPLVGTWIPHGRYYYSMEFVRTFADVVKYEIHSLSSIRSYVRRGKRVLIHVVYIKMFDGFVSPEDFSKLDIFDSGDMRKTGNYDNLRSRKKHNSWE